MHCLYTCALYANEKKINDFKCTFFRLNVATCKSPPESYARHSSSMGTDCVITNAMVTQSTQPSSTLKAILETHDSRNGQGKCWKLFIYAMFIVLEEVTCWKLRTKDPEDLRENTLLPDHFLVFFFINNNWRQLQTSEERTGQEFAISRI